jgi:hypothetical protein
MIYPLLVLLILPADEPTKSERKLSAIAPSLRALTKDEEAKLDDIIDRFILADTGRLGGAEARKATDAFDKLGHDAIPALIRGLNKAATLKHSCPVLMITKKLTKLLMATDDQQLLEFARDEIGAGVTRSPHAGTMQDLRVRILLHKNALARRTPTPKKTAPPLGTAELAKAASSQRGEALHTTLKELAKREGKEVIPALALAAGSYEKETQKLGRELLDSHIARQTQSFVREILSDENVEIRKSAIRVIASKHHELIPNMIDKLTDDDALVRAEGRAALRKLAKTIDFGPAPDATKEQQREAQKRWRGWWEKK